MNKYKLVIIAIAGLLIVLLGCFTSKDINANLGEDFSLDIGQSVYITGEGLEIEFVDVTGDSRCPEGVTCIWAGEVTAKVSIRKGNLQDELIVTESGLSNGEAETIYQEYRLTYHVEPYPEHEKTIAKNQYQLVLTVTK
jgi:hypothetical protein